MNDLSFNDGNSETEYTRGGYEIVLAVSGVNVEADGKVYSVEAGGAVVIPPAVKRRIKCGNTVVAVLDKALLPVRQTTVIPAGNCLDLRSAAELAKRQFDSGKADAGVVNAYGNLIAAVICALMAPEGYSPVVNAVVEDLEKHLADSSYSLESFIRTLPLNYDYVRKLFKKEVGMTPHEYLTRARMEQAKNIIVSRATNRYSDYTVTQIAEACGFSEPLYFSRVFKKYFGVAPSYYLNGIKD